MKRIRIIFLTIVAVILPTCLVYAIEDVKVGDPCPQITLNNVQTNQPTNLNEISKGKVTVITYMQTSCAACRKELDKLKEMLEYAPEANVIAISVDVGSPERIQKYIEHYKYPFTFLHDPNFSTPELFGFSYTPATVAIDKSGKILFFTSSWQGGFNKGCFERIQEALAK